jgi:hypothetical protein
MSSRHWLEVRDTLEMTLLEFWPDHGPGPLWTDDGKPVDLRSLDLSVDLVEQLEDWNSQYAEKKIPLEGLGDARWLNEGRNLLCRTRDALGPGYQLVVTEPWWGENPT